MINLFKVMIKSYFFIVITDNFSIYLCQSGQDQDNLITLTERFNYELTFHCQIL
jgi:hypothetical protein